MRWHLLWRPAKNNLISFSQALLEHNATVYMGSRSRSKAEAAIKDLKESTGKEAIFLELDLSNLTSVRKSAEEFLRYVIFSEFMRLGSGP